MGAYRSTDAKVTEKTDCARTSILENKKISEEEGEDALNKADKRRKAKEILEIAKRYGVQENFFFATTFERYVVQLDMLDKLEKVIKKEGTLVEKEYVKGRKNLVANPAIAEYNKTTTSANGTITTLMKIIDSIKESDADAAKELMEFIQGQKC